jgi:hypothetical protein
LILFLRLLNSSDAGSGLIILLALCLFLFSAISVKRKRDIYLLPVCGLILLVPISIDFRNLVEHQNADNMFLLTFVIFILSLLLAILNLYKAKSLL